MAIQDYSRICQACGKTYLKNKKRNKSEGNKYCSRACAFGAHKDWNVQSIKHLSEPPKYTSVYFKHCAVCNRSFVTSKRRQVTCSLECRVMHSRAISLKSSVNKRDFTPITCKCCGVVFVSSYGSKRRDFCSKECSIKFSRRVTKALRRARQRDAIAENIDPFYVFRRDNWKCQLCGIKTPEVYRGTYKDNAPELDHIVPLAKGGSHTYRNTQCACRKCNRDKRDSVIGQLLMFG